LEVLIGDVLGANSYIEGVQGGTDDGQLKPEEMGDVEIEDVKVADARQKHEGVQIGCIQVDCRSGRYCKLELRNYKLDLNCTGSSEDIWHEVCFVP
jgi:hypothetical protein